MKRLLYIIPALIALLAIGVGIKLANARVALGEDDFPEIRVNIPTGSSYDALRDSIGNHDCHWASNRVFFNLVAQARSLPDHVKGGSYIIDDGMTVVQLVTKMPLTSPSTSTAPSSSYACFSGRNSNSTPTRF